CIFGGALFGLFLHRVLPEHHRSKETQDVVKLGMGMVASMAALVLGLLVASAKGAYDTRRSELIQLSASAVILDRVLAHYGPGAGTAREQLRRTLAVFAHRIWPEEHFAATPPDLSMRSSGEELYDALERLSPRNDDQRWLKSQALTTALSLGQTRWLLYEQ